MIWILPLLFQAGLMSVDEFYFHRRRGLGRWERLGHPVDTLLFLVCCAYIAAQPADPAHLMPYVILSGLSCLVITKDEFVHAQACSAGEGWLHSLLFVLHPIVLFSLWQLKALGQVFSIWMQLAAVSGFFAFQVFYWNRSWLLSK
jgi:hypothetical protein